MDVKAARKAAADEALNLAEDIAAARVDAADLVAAAVEAARDVAGTVIGPEDPAWELQVQICRDVLALGGVPANELAEWAAVQADAEGPVQAVSWIEAALAAGADEDGDDECLVGVYP